MKNLNQSIVTRLGIHLFLCSILLFASIAAGKISMAAEFDTLTPVQLQNADQWETEVIQGYAKDMTSSEMGEVSNAYVQFTLPEDSYVHFGTGFLVNKSSNGMETPKAYVYASPSMSKRIMELRMPLVDQADSADKTIMLTKGTYYMKFSFTQSSEESISLNIQLQVAYIPMSKLISVTQTISKDKSKATIKITEGFGSQLRTLQYMEGEIPKSRVNDTGYWDVYEQNGSNSAIQGKKIANKTFTVTKNGTYTIRIDNNAKYDYNATLYTFKVTGLNKSSSKTGSKDSSKNSSKKDKKKPTVKGVKNGKTYRKAVKIRFYDKGSGIKKALLNGKKIKSGKKVKKNGRYTLKVYDKAGNVKKIKFRIKKKKKKK